MARGNRTPAEFMGNGLEAELGDELGYSKHGYKTKTQATAVMSTAARPCVRAFGMWRRLSPEIGRVNLSLKCSKRIKPVSVSTISRITDKILPIAREWQLRNSGKHVPYKDLKAPLAI